MKPLVDQFLDDLLMFESSEIDHCCHEIDYEIVLMKLMIVAPWCMVMWCRGVVVITTARLHSTNPELRFCAGTLTMAPAGNKVKRSSSVNQTTKTIHHHHL